MTKNNKTALIDADSLIFYSSKDTIEESLDSLKSRITNNLTVTESDSFILFLTGNKGFRYDIYPEYKQNRKKRKYAKKLKYLKTLKAFMIEEYNACLIQELEADDLVAYYKIKFDSIVCSPDKDVLHQVIGNNYNYGKDIWIETTQISSDRFLAWQLLCGDATDNIPGIKEKTKYMKDRFGLDNRQGIGEVSANKILDIIDDKYNGNYAKEVANCYISKYKTIDEYTAIEDTAFIEAGLADYNMNRYLLTLEPSISRYNKILDTYDIDQHINTREIEITTDDVEDF